MLDTTVFFPVSTTLAVILWIEVVLYLGTGVFEIFDDFFKKSPSWVSVNGRINYYIWFAWKKNHKIHGTNAMLMGFVALNGLIEGQVNRLEVEYIFLSLALLNCSIWTMLPPMPKLALRLIPITPEVLLQVSIFFFFTDMIRPEVLALCVFFNLWGIFVFFRHTLRHEGAPLPMERWFSDMAQGGASQSTINGYANFSGYKLKSAEATTGTDQPNPS